MPSDADPFHDREHGGVTVLAHRGAFIRHSQALGMNMQAPEDQPGRLPDLGPAPTGRRHERPGRRPSAARLRRHARSRLIRSPATAPLRPLPCRPWDAYLRTPVATDCCARIKAVTAAIRQRRVDASSYRGCSAYAPSSRSSGASCTSLILIVRLNRQPVYAVRLPSTSVHREISASITAHFFSLLVVRGGRQSSAAIYTTHPSTELREDSAAAWHDGCDR